MKKKLFLAAMGMFLAFSQQARAQFAASCLQSSISINTGYNHPATSLYASSPSSASPVLDHYWQVTTIPANTTGLAAPKCAEMFLSTLNASSWPNDPDFGYIGVVANAHNTNTAQLSPSGNFFWNCPPSTPYAPTKTPTVFTRTFYVQSSNPTENITINIPTFYGDDYATIMLDGTTYLYQDPSTSQTGGVTGAVTGFVASVTPGVHTIDVQLWDVSGQGSGIKLEGTISSPLNILVDPACFGMSNTDCTVPPPPARCNANFSAYLTLHTTPVNSATGMPFPIPDKSVQLELDHFEPSSSYMVDYGDGTIMPYMPTPFFHTYPGPGTYRICITETTIAGNTCVSCYTICIGDNRPTGTAALTGKQASTTITKAAADHSVSIVPNPTHANADIALQLSSNSQVRIAVTDMTGKQVAEVFSGQMNAGSQKVTVNTDNLSSGIYQVQVQIGDNAFTQKLSVIK